MICPACEHEIHPVQAMAGGSDIVGRGKTSHFVDKCPRVECGAVLGVGGSQTSPVDVQAGAEEQKAEVLPLPVKAPPPPAIIELPKKTNLMPATAEHLAPPTRTSPSIDLALREQAEARLRENLAKQAQLEMEERLLRDYLAGSS